MGIGIVELAILSVFFALLVYGAIAKRAGFSRWWSLLMLVPIVNLICIWIFAFVKWPALRKAA